MDVPAGSYDCNIASIYGFVFIISIYYFKISGFLSKVNIDGFFIISCICWLFRSGAWLWLLAAGFYGGGGLFWESGLFWRGGLFWGGGLF